MKVAEIMSRGVHIANPQQTIGEIARQMADEEIGFMPVGENDQLVGTITDRDMVVRGLADGLGGDAKVREVMNRDVKYCFEDEDVDDVTRNMGQVQVRRLPVVNREKRLTGVISLADAALVQKEAAGAGLKKVARPGGSHAS
ncbi:CBS domain-containing protein [Rhizobium sp. ERR 922]|uniref:CBS domain-containing protein n=1 Tax=unclassified Rhizobium TaxID=2613769 RepID=UPI0011A968AC|nr:MULTISPECIES: CBS domain-containing protein [unclassified Rhizobium]TWB42772.1 CBS domain-containing protein [Rhizobium sp. ERR 922]TWB88238.1 CBS domain-containing protein [Rhizobium sp. ERR 942]